MGDRKGGQVGEAQIAEALNSVFGFRGFRANQEEIIRAVLAGRDVFAVMPTGGGKSLCYQLPAYLMSGMCVVVSPLISLMKDQVDAARDTGLRAEYLNSSLEPAARSEVLRALSAGRLDLLYVAPERFVMESFQAALKRVSLCLFAVDEAHCISEWGHDFRPDYLSLSTIVERFPEVPLAAFTATATQRVQGDIIERLALRSPHVVRASFDRPNLFYRVEPKNHVEEQVLTFLREHPGEAGIVYRTTRKDVESTAESLAAHGVKALPYHAGLAAETRKAHQDAFNRDEVDVIVATIAFGMGIDKSNVRFVVHGDLPKNIESYYQETGRSGRDGEPAMCVLFFGRGDTARIRYFVDQIEDETQRKVALGKLNEMVRFATANACRRRQLLGYFGEKLPGENCGGCDVCSGQVERVDATRQAQIVMSAIARTGQRFGAVHVVDVVTGADTQKIRDFGHDSIKTYGAGEGTDKRAWRKIIDDLLVQGCLVQSDGRYPTLQLTPRGLDVLYGRQEFHVLKQKPAAPKPRTRRQAGGQEIDYDQALFEQLRSLRQELARQRGVPPYVVFSDRTLHELAARMPTTLDRMRGITGVGERKLDQYGTRFLAAILTYVQAHPNARPPAAAVEPPPARPRASASGRESKTVDETWQLLGEGLSFREIAERRGLTPATIVGHIEQLIRAGRDVDIDPHVAPPLRKRVEQLLRRHADQGLRPIVEGTAGAAGYEEVRLVRVKLERERRPPSKGSDRRGAEGAER